MNWECRKYAVVDSLIDAVTIQNMFSLTTCDYGTGELICEKKDDQLMVIDIIKAKYGRLDDKTCVSSESPSNITATCIADESKVCVAS